MATCNSIAIYSNLYTATRDILVSYKTVLFAPGRRPGAAPQGRVAAERSEDGLTPEGLLTRL